jgi:DNA polymerase-3 subunit gamma/tau
LIVLIPRGVAVSYLSFYRKYRPQTFEDVVGQEHIVRTIRNAIELDRVSHAYLFCGPRGTGKTTMAKLLAKGLNCADGPTQHPCGVCSSCLGITAGTSVDVIEIDAASNRGINEIRDLREKIRYAPSASRFKVYIVDEVHMLTAEAFNALLKTLEEPPHHAVFILATTEPHRIPETIHSRCQRFDFHKLSPAEIAGHLRTILEREGGEAEDDALRVIALHGDGSVRDAISILEQCYSYSGDRITVDDVSLVLGITPMERILELVEAISERDIGALLRLVSDLSVEGRDFRQFLRDAVSVYRDLIVVQLSTDGEHGVQCPMMSRISFEDAKRVANELDSREYMYVLEKLANIESDLRTSVQQSITFEVGLIELVESIDSRADITAKPDLESLSRRLLVVERQMAQLIRKLSERSGAAASSEAVPRRAFSEAEAPSEGAPLGEASSGASPLGTVRPKAAPLGAPMKEEAPLGTASSEAVSSQAVRADAAAQSAERPERVDRPKSIGSGDRAAVASAEAGAVEGVAGEAQAAPSVMDPEELGRVFADVLEGVKDRARLLHAVLKEGRPLSFENGVLTIGFGSRRSFHMGRVGEAKNRNLIEEVAALVVGEPVRIAVREVDSDDAAEDGVGSHAGARKSRRSARSSAEPARPEDDRLVRQVLEIFQGRIVDSEAVEKDGDTVEGKHQQADETGSENAGRDAEGPG